MEGEAAAEPGPEVAHEDAVMAVGEGPPAAAEYGEEDMVAAPMVPAEAPEAPEAVAEMVPEAALEAVAEMVPEAALEAPQEALGADAQRDAQEPPQVDAHAHQPAPEAVGEMVVTEAALEAPPQEEALGAEAPDAVPGRAPPCHHTSPALRAPVRLCPPAHAATLADASGVAAPDAVPDAAPDVDAGVVSAREALPDAAASVGVVPGTEAMVLEAAAAAAKGAETPSGAAVGVLAGASALAQGSIAWGQQLAQGQLAALPLVAPPMPLPGTGGKADGADALAAAQAAAAAAELQAPTLKQYLTALFPGQTALQQSAALQQSSYALAGLTQQPAMVRSRLHLSPPQPLVYRPPLSVAVARLCSPTCALVHAQSP